MPKFSRMWLYGAAALAALAAVIGFFIQDAQRARLPAPPPLVNTFDKSPSGFTFKYPEGWEYMIPMQGVLVAGPPATLFENQPGPTLTVQRGLPISILGSLEGA